MRTSKEMITASTSVASPETSAAAFDALPITPRCLAAKRLQREIEPALAVGSRALEPGVPGSLGRPARLVELFPGRFHDRHAQLRQALPRPLLRRGGVLPLLLLEVGLLDGVEHRLLQVLRQGVPRLLVRHQPLF